MNIREESDTHLTTPVAFLLPFILIDQYIIAHRSVHFGNRAEGDSAQLLTIVSHVATATSLWPRKLADAKILRVDALDDGGKSLLHMRDYLWSIANLHQSVLASLLARPVEQQAVRPAMVALFKRVGIGAKLAFVVNEFWGVKRGTKIRLEINQFLPSVVYAQ